MVARIRFFKWQKDRRFGIQGALVLIGYTDANGPQVLLTLTSGWHGGSPKHDATLRAFVIDDTSRFMLFIEDQPAVTEDIMLNQLRRFQITNPNLPTRDFRVVDGGIMPPMAKDRRWRVIGSELRAGALT